MSNTGKFFQSMIDDVRGKTQGRRARIKRKHGRGKLRKRQQIVFEARNPTEGTGVTMTSDPTKMKGFGKNGLDGKRVKRFIRQEGMIKRVLAGGGVKG